MAKRKPKPKATKEISILDFYTELLGWDYRKQGKRAAAKRKKRSAK